MRVPSWNAQSQNEKAKIKISKSISISIRKKLQMRAHEVSRPGTRLCIKNEHSRVDFYTSFIIDSSNYSAGKSLVSMHTYNYIEI